MARFFRQAEMLLESLDRQTGATVAAVKDEITTGTPSTHHDTQFWDRSDGKADMSISDLDSPPPPHVSHPSTVPLPYQRPSSPLSVFDSVMSKAAQTRTLDNRVQGLMEEKERDVRDAEEKMEIAEERARVLALQAAQYRKHHVDSLAELGALQREFADGQVTVRHMKTQLLQLEGENRRLQLDLSEYKARSAKVLQDKESSIGELRKARSENGAPSGDGVSPDTLEFEKLRRQFEDVSLELRVSRATLTEHDEKALVEVEKYQEQISLLENECKTLTEKSKNVEIDATRLSQEHSVLSAQHQALLAENEVLKIQRDRARREAERASRAGAHASLDSSVSGLDIVADRSSSSRLMAAEARASDRERELAVLLERRNRDVQVLREQVAAQKLLLESAESSLQTPPPPAHRAVDISDEWKGKRRRHRKRQARGWVLSVLQFFSFLDEFVLKFLKSLRSTPWFRMGAIAYLVLLHVYVGWVLLGAQSSLAIEPIGDDRIANLSPL